jgi:pilus assembly protein Flp/PilA
MKNLLVNFLRDEDGAALVEYGIALLVVIMVGTGALIAVAGDTTTLFGRAETATGAAVSASAP